MPCNSDYLASTAKEVAGSQVECLLGELKGITWKTDWWRGYHPKVYNRKYDLDEKVAELCGKLLKVDIKQYSLEMQMWWRDHQKADAKRLMEEGKP